MAGTFRQAAAAGAVVTSVAIGLRDTFGDPDRTPVVAPAPDFTPLDDPSGITVFFHPDVPEATLVLVRRAH